jgi:hypothetical protein
MVPHACLSNADDFSGRFGDGQRLEVARQRRHNGACDVGRRELRAGRRCAPARSPRHAPFPNGGGWIFSFVLFAADRPRLAGVSAKRAILRHDVRCSHEVARFACYYVFNDLNVRAQIVSRRLTVG